MKTKKGGAPLRRVGRAEKSLSAENVSIVLVEPISPGNIGSVARAMKNTGFTRLKLINPCEHKCNESFSMACKAHEVLLGAEVFPDIASATKGGSVIVGTTRRKGRLRYPVLTLDEAIPGIAKLASGNKVDILFGREDKGLKNEEIQKCGILVEIPVSPGYPSLNLSHAFFIVCYSLFRTENPAEPVIKAAPKEETERMYEHLESALRSLGYGEAGGEGLLSAIMRSFRRLFGRTALMQKEINMLRGIFTQIKERTR